MADRQPKIYVLCEPDTEEVRYVGKTIRGLKLRHYQHVYDARDAENRTNYRLRWIGSLLDRGVEPVIRLLEIVPSGRSWKRAERRWVAYYRSQGARLVNGTDGGDGCAGLCEEARKKIRDAQLGKPRTAGAKLSISKGRKSAYHKRVEEATPKVIEMRLSGLSIDRIAAILHLGDKTVRGILRDNQVNVVTPIGRRKKTYDPNRCDRVLEAHQRGESYRAIGKAEGISKEIVARIVHQSASQGPRSKEDIIYALFAAGEYIDVIAQKVKWSESAVWDSLRASGAILTRQEPTSHA